MKYPAAVFSFVVCLLILGLMIDFGDPGSLVSVLLFSPLFVGPLFVSIFLGFRYEAKGAQWVIALGSLLYLAWATLMYLDVTRWHPDPQAAIGFMFMGPYSLVVMIPLWIWAVILGRRGRRNRAPVVE